MYIYKDMTYRTHPTGKWLTEKMYELWSVGDNTQSCSHPCKAEGMACTNVVQCKEMQSIRNTGKTLLWLHGENEREHSVRYG